MTHTTVLLQESIDGLSLQKGQTVLDGTFGGGGHSWLIAGAIGETGRLIAIDADEDVFARFAADAFPCKTHFVVENFRNIDRILSDISITNVDAALFDLGMSSMSIESSGRGFSFQRDEPLLMTYTKHPRSGDVTAETVVNDWGEETLVDIFRGFGEERFAKRIAHKIIEARTKERILTTGKLVDTIAEAVPAWYGRGKSPATRTFQAIRMAVNDELGAIKEGLSGAVRALRPGGRLAVITFHSIEDRVVKHLFKALASEQVIKPVTKKPIVPSKKETGANPRSRSAKLRIVEKI